MKHDARTSTHTFKEAIANATQDEKGPKYQYLSRIAVRWRREHLIISVSRESQFAYFGSVCLTSFKGPHCRFVKAKSFSSLSPTCNISKDDTSFSKAFFLDNGLARAQRQMEKLPGFPSRPPKTAFRAQSPLQHARFFCNVHSV